MKLHREIVNEGFNMKTGQTEVIRYRAWSEKCTDQPHLTCDQPLLSIPHFILPCSPLSLHVLSSVFIVISAMTPNIQGPGFVSLYKLVPL